MMQFKSSQVLGLNTDQKAAQVIYQQREDNSFVAVLDLTCDDAFTKGRQILSDLADFYFDFDVDKSPADRLKATFEEVLKKIAPGSTGVLVAAISGKILYLIGKGGVDVYLKRSEKLLPLLSKEGHGQLISGFLQQDDRLLFSTSTLSELLTDDLGKSIDLPDDSFEEEITTRISSSNLQNQGLAGLRLEVDAGPDEPNSIPNLQQELVKDSKEEDEDLPSYEPPKTMLVTVLKNVLSKLARIIPKSGKGRLIIAVGLIVVIALGVGFKIKSAKDAQKQALFSQFLQQSKDDFNTAKGLAILNTAEAKTKLDSAKDKLNQALKLKPGSSEALSFKKQIADESSSILLQSEVSDFPLFLDMDLVKKDFRAAQMSFSNGKLLLLDPTTKTLVTVDLVKKSNQILAGSEQLGQATASSINGGLAFIFSKDKGVLRVDITNQKVSAVAKKDSDLVDIKDIYGFGGNVYLLDTGMIWKYLATSDGYSDKREYLNKGVKAEFGDSIRMQIESSIYILKKSGEMLRFTRGDKDNFSYGGLDKGIKDPKSFFVSSDSDNLYVLDSGNSRLLILTKTGSYKGQITGSQFAQMSDLVVDEKGKKVYLLDGSKFYQVDLK